MSDAFKDTGPATAGEALASIVAAFSGAQAVVTMPAVCLPVLTQAARLKPRPDGLFAFTAPNKAVRRCGWGERLLALMLLVLFMPFFLVLAALVLTCEGTPVFFRQKRYGFNGMPFTVFKFRTMMRRSECLHEKLQQKLGHDDRLFKLERDPRVTRLGVFLRGTFLDEWPQLLNVARGEMRFIGPRPLPASDQRHYTRPCHALRLQGLPGITGLWQVSGRNERTFDEMCLLDCYYLCHRTLAMDLWLLMRTVRVVLKEICLARKP